MSTTSNSLIIEQFSQDIEDELFSYILILFNDYIDSFSASYNRMLSDNNPLFTNGLSLMLNKSFEEIQHPDTLVGEIHNDVRCLINYLPKIIFSQLLASIYRR